MSICIISEVAGREYWKEQVLREKKQGTKEFIFLGNYFGDTGPLDGQIINFIDITKFYFNRTVDMKVTLLLGPRDFQYLYDFDQYEDYDYRNSKSIANVLKAASDIFKVAAEHKKWVFSNSGINTEFLKHLNMDECDLPDMVENINLAFKNNPSLFKIILNRHGELDINIGQSPFLCSMHHLFLHPLRSGTVQVINGEERKDVTTLKTVICCNAQTGNSYAKIDGNEVYTSFLSTFVDQTGLPY
jgi:hypothetical protein